MSSEKELTPEEKLLALIQQDKRPAAPSPAPVAAPSAPAVTPAAAPAIPASPAPESREVRASVPPVPAVPPPPSAPVAEARPAAPVQPAPAEPKLKLAPVVAPAAKPEVPVAAPAKPVSPEVVAAPVAEVAPVAPAALAAAPAKGAARKAVRLSVGRGIGWTTLNRGLALVVLVLLVVVVYSVASIQTGVDRAMASQAEEAGSNPVQPPNPEPAKGPSLEECLQKVSGRDIFQPVEAAVVGETNAAPKQVEFKLVGVSVDSKVPSASMAILRSRASSQTFFVKVGDMLGDTGYTLDRVLPDRAVLKKQKQELEVK